MAGGIKGSQVFGSSHGASAHSIEARQFTLASMAVCLALLPTIWSFTPSGVAVLFFGAVVAGNLPRRRPGHALDAVLALLATGSAYFSSDPFDLALQQWLAAIVAIGLGAAMMKRCRRRPLGRGL